MATPSAAGSVRLLLDIQPTQDDGVMGVATDQYTGRRQRFAGWLELLQLLETAVGRLTGPDSSSRF
jgi:hypothetical protein